MRLAFSNFIIYGIASRVSNDDPVFQMVRKARLSSVMDAWVPSGPAD